MEIASFQTFLAERIKVAGKAGALGDVVSVSNDKTKVTVVDLRSQLAQATATLENTRKDSDDFSSIREEFDKRVVDNWSRNSCI